MPYFKTQEIAQAFSAFDAVVFDAGGVIVRWDPPSILARAQVPLEEYDTVLNAVYNHTDWLALDRGTLEYDEALTRFSSRLGWTISRIAELIDFTQESLTLIPETVELISQLRVLGKRLYLLSNMPKYAFNFLSARDRLWSEFDGDLVSYRVKMLKPEAEIYAALKKVLQVPAQKAVFFDDRPDNVQASRQNGIPAVLFTTVSDALSELTNGPHTGK